MLKAPLCSSVGSQCRSLRVTLRVATIEAGEPSSVDHEATWLLGHTERIQFGGLRFRGKDLLAKANLLVPCRHARMDRDHVHCQAHGFHGVVPTSLRTRGRRQSRQLGGDRFEIFEQQTLRPVRLPAPAATKALPVLTTANPCATAHCRTADNTVGAACCRDLQVEILCPPSSRMLESLVRARKSPYLCKVDRESPDSLGAEMVSACSFLEPKGVLCTLHGRTRGDGRTAKPDLCFAWPKPGDTYHRGCVLKPKPR